MLEAARSAAVRAPWRQRRKPQPVGTVKVSPAWKAAVRAAEGRFVIRIINASTVIVTNQERAHG